MGRDRTLPERYRAILSSCGIVLLIGGFVMILPLPVLFFTPEESVFAVDFIMPALILLSAGLVLWRSLSPGAGAVLTVQEGGIVVVVGWVAVCVASAVPFMTATGLNFNNALFESVSGWTTTGLSVVDVEKAPRIVLVWRSVMQLAGGAGLAVIMLSAITGPVGPGLSVAEGRSDQLVPNVIRSAKLVLALYAGYAAAGVAAYTAAGMSFFDAVNHSFAAVSTGGFSTRTNSIGEWDSFLIEAVTIVLMFLGSMNFLTSYMLFTRRFKDVWRNGEVRLVLFLIPVFTVLLFLLTVRGAFPSTTKAVRVALFETVTALTTTGFSTVAYGPWNGAGVGMLIVLMLIGGGTGSTAGGIKQYRVYLLYRAVIWEIRRSMLPRKAVPAEYIWQGGKKVFIDDRAVRLVAVFVFLYLVTLATGTLFLTACGYPLRDALFEFSSALGTVGLSIGVTSATAHPLALASMTAGMFLGRLEFFVIITGFVKMVKDLTARGS